MMPCNDAVFVVLVLGGYFIVFVWVGGSCLAVSRLDVLVGIDVYKIACNVFHSGNVWLQPTSILGMASREQKPR